MKYLDGDAKLIVVVIFHLSIPYFSAITYYANTDVCFIYVTENWEGPDAIEECSEVEPARRLTPQHSEESEESSSEDSTEAQAEFESDDPSTEDEYVAEKDKRKERGIATKV